MFAASIFDMDGLLVDSERLWHEAEVEILGGLGVPLARDDCRRTKGMVVNDVTRYWHERYLWATPTTDEVAGQIVDRVRELVLTEGKLQPGALTAIDRCRRHRLPVALASSSQYRLIDAVLGHFDLAGAFDVVHSAQDEPYGKPHPGVFLTAAAKLGVRPEACVAWEDAPAGVLAAKAARMACVAVPEPAERGHPYVAIADVVLDSLEQMDDRCWDALVERHESDALAAPGAPGS